jgi:capsular polysaccharide biosynthesis protein
MKDFFNNQQILEIIWKRKTHLIIIGAIAIVLSAFFSSPIFITPKYKSVARIYPSRNVMTFSEESTSEQLLEVINSTDIKLKVIDALRLDTVYKIKKSEPKYMTYILGAYNENIKTSKTEYETIEISVLDKNPGRASVICDSLIHFYNLKVAEMHAVKYMEIVDLTEKRLGQKYAELDSLQPVFDKYRDEYSIFDYENQIKEVTRAYMRALSSNPGAASTSALKTQYENLKKYGDEALIVEKRYMDTRLKIDSMIETKIINLAEANKRITYSETVETPLPADKKAYPIRWLIVALSLGSTLFAGILLFLILDYKKKE